MLSYRDATARILFQRGVKGSGPGSRTIHPGVGRGHGGKTGPGARGGKFWINSKGNPDYGPPPSGTKSRTPEQWQSHTNGLARAEVRGVKTAADLNTLSDKGWESGVAGPQEAKDAEGNTYNHFGSGAGGKAAATAQIAVDAAKHPDQTYILLKIDGNYVTAAKTTADLLKSSPDKQGSGPRVKAAGSKLANVA